MEKESCEGSVVGRAALTLTTATGAGVGGATTTAVTGAATFFVGGVAYRVNDEPENGTSKAIDSLLTFSSVDLRRPAAPREAPSAAHSPFLLPSAHY